MLDFAPMARSASPDAWVPAGGVAAIQAKIDDSPVLHVELNGETYDWCTLAELGEDLRSPTLHEMMQDNIAHYFGVPIECQAVADESGRALMNAADWRRMLQQPAPCLRLADLRCEGMPSAMSRQAPQGYGAEWTPEASSGGAGVQDAATELVWRGGAGCGRTWTQRGRSSSAQDAYRPRPPRNPAYNKAAPDAAAASSLNLGGAGGGAGEDFGATLFSAPGPGAAQAGRSWLREAEFEVTLCKDAPGSFFGFMVAEHGNLGTLQVTYVDPASLLAQWNADFPEAALCDGDFVVSVNGITDKPPRMREELTMANQVQLRGVRRVDVRADECLC